MRQMAQGLYRVGKFTRTQTRLGYCSCEYENKGAGAFLSGGFPLHITKYIPHKSEVVRPLSSGIGLRIAQNVTRHWPPRESDDKGAGCQTVLDWFY